jgi:hypothetical protein
MVGFLFSVGCTRDLKRAEPKPRLRPKGAEIEKALEAFASKAFNFGVADGARTHDNRNHNPGLYQLSYNHRRA